MGLQPANGNVVVVTNCTEIEAVKEKTTANVKRKRAKATDNA
jgi:hypothetical protein